VDIDRDRPTFGLIVGDYSGNVEQHIAGHDATALRKTPACPSPTDDVIHRMPTFDPRESDFQGILEDDPVCGQLDLDFGAAANLFTDRRSGALLVGDLQKSGVYHVVRTDTMTDFNYTADGSPQSSSTKSVWTAEVGQSCELCNSSSTAYDALTRTVFADVAPGTFMVAISAEDGSVRWRTPVGDGAHYQSVSYANGVVYTVDNGGRLLAFDADNGSLLLQESLIPAAADMSASTIDTGLDSITFGSGGVSVARHSVFAADGSHIIALRVK
jgi:outer membrane protein assembly factor BamB